MNWIWAVVVTVMWLVLKYVRREETLKAHSTGNINITHS